MRYLFISVFFHLAMLMALLLILHLPKKNQLSNYIPIVLKQFNSSQWYGNDVRGNISQQRTVSYSLYHSYQQKIGSNSRRVLYQPKISRNLPDIKNLVHQSQLMNQHSSKLRAAQFKAKQFKVNLNTETLLGMLHSAIAEVQVYPESAMELNQGGKVNIGFTLHPDGRLTNITITKSSGYLVLDQAALMAVQKIALIKNAHFYLFQPQFFTIDIIFSPAG